MFEVDFWQTPAWNIFLFNRKLHWEIDYIRWKFLPLWSRAHNFQKKLVYRSKATEKNEMSENKISVWAIWVPTKWNVAVVRGKTQSSIVLYFGLDVATFQRPLEKSIIKNFVPNLAVLDSC